MIVITLVLIEMKIKNYIEKNRQLGEEQEILNGRLILKKEYNEGMALNFLENQKEMVKTISFIVLGLILLPFLFLLPKKGNTILKLGLSFVIGGAISNVYDRMIRGYVIDYFKFNSTKLKNLKKIIFNLADIFIFFGSFLILLQSIFPLKFKS